MRKEESKEKSKEERKEESKEGSEESEVLLEGKESHLISDLWEGGEEKHLPPP